jgi:catechol 2,3-dioxygenase-like lactoylglutathione lyase family enzyme
LTRSRRKPSSRWARIGIPHVPKFSPRSRRSSERGRPLAGPSIELFEYEDTERLPPPTPSDLGIQHFGIYVDDIDLACERVAAAGGTVLDGPTLLPSLESGEDNKWVYVVPPWGGIIELCSYPSPQLYEETTEVRRWRPPQRAPAGGGT